MSRKEQEGALLILEEINRRQENDPLHNFKLHPKQQVFADSVLKGLKSENWFVAANRAGKTDVGAFCGSTFARFGDQSARPVGAADSTIKVRDVSTSGWVSALDFPTSRDTIQPKYFDNGFSTGDMHEPFIPDREIEEWRQGDQILKLKNGSIIGFKSAESGRRKYQGAEKNWVHMDEEHPEDIYDEIGIRVGRTPLKIFITATLLPPEGQIGGVSWSFPKIIQPAKEGRLDYVGLFGASIYDNPHIPILEIERLEAKYPPGSVQRRIRLNGEMLPGMGGSRAYTNFNRMINSRTQPEINLRRPLAWMWDFNVEPMVSAIGQYDGEMFRVHQELILDEGNTQEMCQLFYEAHPEHYAEIWIYGDATGKRRGTRGKVGETDYTIIMNEMNNYGVPLRMKVPDANPSVPDRINAMNLACSGRNGLVSLEIDPTCVELTADFEQVLRDGRGGIKKTYSRKDAYFRRTHISDAVGYWVAYEKPVRRLRPRGAAKHKKIAPQKYNFRGNR